MSEPRTKESGRRTASDVIETLRHIADMWWNAGRDSEAAALEEALEELDRRMEDGRV